MTFTLETTRSGPGGRQRSTQVFTRSHDRVRLALKGARQEWLFLQNVVYRDRAIGYLIDHDKQRSSRPRRELAAKRDEIRGWMDVLTLRFDPSVLAKLRDTDERRMIGEAIFKRYVATLARRDGSGSVVERRTAAPAVSDDTGFKNYDDQHRKRTRTHGRRGGADGSHVALPKLQGSGSGGRKRSLTQF